VLSDGRRREAVPVAVYERNWVDGLVRPRRFTDVWIHPDRLDAPLRWRKPSTVFVNSMSDLFHDAVPDAFIDKVFGVMALCPRHVFIVLTKRPERMRAYLVALAAEDGDRPPIIPARIIDAGDGLLPKDDIRQVSWDFPAWPLPNVWLGVSVEDQATADERIPLLLQTPAALRFVSAEPLLGPIDLNRVENPGRMAEGQRYLDVLKGYAWDTDGCGGVDVCGIEGKLGWLIVGGESGPRARECNVAWVRSLKNQAASAGVSIFCKQLGSAWARKHGGDRKGGNPVCWPADLRVREWPA